MNANASILSQLGHSDLQHEQSCKRIWSQIKQYLEQEQQITQRQRELKDKLIVENNKNIHAENDKTKSQRYKRYQSFIV